LLNLVDGERRALEQADVDGGLEHQHLIAQARRDMVSELM
jgi:hypothetical protein